MEPTVVRIGINLDPFTNQLQGEVMADLVALRIVLKAIDDSTYESVKEYSSRNHFMVWSINPLPDSGFLRAREITKCLKAVVGSLQDYMDRLIAVMRFLEEAKRQQIVTATPTTAEKMFSERFAKLLSSISKDRSLTAPRKLQMLLGNDSMKEVAQNYFDLRNGLEHHKGIANKSKVTTFKRMSFVATENGKTLREVAAPSILNAGEALAVQIVDEQIAFNEGDAIALNYSQVENIIFTITMHIIPKMTQAVIDLTAHAGS